MTEQVGHLPAHDDLARERLCRYLARPAFSLARLAVRRDGLVVYRVKNAGRGRVKQRVTLAARVSRAPGAASPMASARGAAPARIAGRMRHVVVQEKEEHELRGRGESRARGRAAWDGRGGARRERSGYADVDAPRDGGGVAGGPNMSPSRTGTGSLAASSTRRVPASIGPPSCAAPSTGVVPRDFAFRYTPSTMTGYMGVADKR